METSAIAHWADALESWAIPQHIVDQAPTSPFRHDTATFAVDDTLDRSVLAAEVARSVLPLSGGAVLDIGCGGGRAAMSLVPPAEFVIGVDQDAAMLASFTSPNVTPERSAPPARAMPVTVSSCAAVP